MRIELFVRMGADALPLSTQFDVALNQPDHFSHAHQSVVVKSIRYVEISFQIGKAWHTDKETDDSHCIIHRLYHSLFA